MRGIAHGSAWLALSFLLGGCATSPVTQPVYGEPLPGPGYAYPNPYAYPYAYGWPGYGYGGSLFFYGGSSYRGGYRGHGGHAVPGHGGHAAPSMPNIPRGSIGGVPSLRGPSMPMRPSVPVPRGRIGR